MMARRPMAASVLRTQQEEDETFGAVFVALHEFADRTIATFFDDAPDMPHPVIGFEKVRSTCRGLYEPKDGLTLAHKIIIDPYKVVDGEEAAEVLAHELVHEWQHHVGRPAERNYHSSEFHNRLGLLGILSAGKHGTHEGYVEGEVWRDWLNECEDLGLGLFVFPGTEAEEEKRQLLKWECPACGFSFRSRRRDVAVLCMNEDCAVEMELVEKE